MKNNRIYNSYLIGFTLSTILTIIPFYIVTCDSISRKILTIMIVLCAITQIFVHLIFFLHLDKTSSQLWNLISLIFTIFIVFILILGSVWIMTHLHHNLMI